MLCPYSFFGLRNTNRKIPHKCIGGKKEKPAIKIKSIDIFCIDFIKCLIHESWFQPVGKQKRFHSTYL